MVDLYSSKPPAQTRVVVAMSGGVDSSVTACLLKQQGYDVVGVTLNLQPQSNSDRRCCGGASDACDAARVCHQIGVPHYVLDYADLFKKEVIDDFLDSYTRGQTPVPCIRCNERVKFADLLRMGQTLEADMLATGHYSILEPIATQPLTMALYTPDDLSKDQTYFLFTMTQAQLNYIRFPLGRFTKQYVRAIAAQNQLVVAAKKDSQDICFVSTHYADMLRQWRPESLKKGPIYHINGTLLGEHEGLPLYTIGQRRGLGVASPDGEPLYVVRLDHSQQAVYLGPRLALVTRKVWLSQTNWLGDAPLTVDGQDIYVKIRSTQGPACARVYLDWDGRVAVDLLEGECGVACGQACVFYEKKGSHARVLGGGWIQETVGSC